MVFCPYHNNYRTPAGEIDKNTGRFFCFSCQENRSLIDFVIFVTKKSYFEAQRFIDSAKVETDIVSLIDSTLEVKNAFEPYDELLIKRLNNQALESPRAIRYFEGRRITVDSIKKFMLGYSANQDMVIIPMQSPDGSMFVGFVARSVEGKDFKNTPKLPKSKILFNLHRAKLHDTVYVVESSFDAIRLDQCGLPAVATLGANVPKSQVELLTKHFNSVIVIPDNDDAGQDMVARVIDKLGSRASAIGLPTRFKDIGDMTDADIEILTQKINDPLFAMY
jgi:DNA primase